MPGTGSSGQAPERPIFFDESQRRWPVAVRIGAVATVVAAAGIAVLVVSLVALPLMPPVHLPKVVVRTVNGILEPALSVRQRHALGFAQDVDKRRLSQLERTRQARRANNALRAAAFLQTTEAREPDTPSDRGSPVIAGFYVDWEETSRASARRNIGNLTHFIPEWLHLRASAARPDPRAAPFVDARQSADRRDLTPYVRSRSVSIVPLINNYTQPPGSEEGAGNWDPKAVHELVASAGARANFVRRVADWLRYEQFQGLNVDFEEVDSADRDGLTLLMQELGRALHASRMILTEDIEIGSDSYDLPALAAACDWLVPMFYDEHSESSAAGPIAGVDWTRRSLADLLKEVPASKVVMGVGNHGYDWTQGASGAIDTTYQSAITVARESQPDAVISLDPTSLNPTFTYSDSTVDTSGHSRDENHTVWFGDAVSVYNQLRVGRPLGIRGAALWYLGSEDPSLWTFLNRSQWDADWRKLVQQGALSTITYGGQGEVDFEGDGELLEPLATPQTGLRSVRLDPASGLITAERYLKAGDGRGLAYPSSHLVRRYGGDTAQNTREVVLTFDDGPDPVWTPQILAVLEHYKVPACFFVVGRNAEAFPYLVRREFDDGDEIGNHSWSHPDLFRLSEEHRRLELTTTERVIEAVTGHSTLLFRPPYGNDTEPETGREVSPLETARSLGYLTVGQKNDPQDWRLFEYRPGTEAVDFSKPRPMDEIWKSVLTNRDTGNIILLHDAGGDRSHTVAALPMIIQGLRALGYRFVRVSDLAGIPDSSLMPKVTGKDLLLAGADRYVFEVSWVVQRTLTTLFALSIILGVSRVLIFVALALIQRWREKRRVLAAGYAPPVSVVIAAYNEEAVIARTVRALLEGDYADLEVIVVDDGSRDSTAAVVDREFADDARVTLIQKANGGKASALNIGIAHARGDILVCLDADTLFARDTVALLVRHFADEGVGAVSGNVRVGNTHNAVTRWQAIEYITSQNFDRRGYDLLNCITVVPGAVGALRRSAVLAVGGYSSNTLAEDTDLTWTLRRAGWRIVNDNAAMAYTEAPETLRNLARQRFRWAYGTLQCLWKHRYALFQNGAFGWVALPSLWIYQFLFPAVSPFMDIAMVWSIFAGNFPQFLAYFLLMAGLDVAAGAIAIRMDRADMRLLPWLVLQRFVYRQLMYYVILKSLVAAVRGGAVGWGKFDRTGSARVATGQ